MERLQKALDMAYRAHAGQVDKAGVPYLFHPIHVAEGVDGIEQKIVALLHDTLEDTELTYENIEKEFGERIAQAVLTMTHSETESYESYVERVSHNELARAVKISDLKHNLDATRLSADMDPDWVKRHHEKYKKALKKLTEAK